MVASFTRAAATEIAGRGITVIENQVGTLHSLCFHALGCPELVAGRIKEWNEAHPKDKLEFEPSDTGCIAGDEPLAKENNGMQRYLDMQVYRAKLKPYRTWPPDVRGFKKRWDAFKEDLGLMDFTDLIETATRECPLAPGNPSVMFLDEAQDFSPLQFKLVRSWGQGMDWFVLVGDDDQLLYSFAGCTPETFFNPPVPDDQKTVLSQSYRVPKLVHDCAQDIIGRVKNREPKQYAPRMENGETVRGEVWRMAEDDSSKMPVRAVELALMLNRQGKTCMFLASCAYMLNNLKKELRARGIPFHNPYRLTQGDWNPLTVGRGISTAEVIASFMDRGEDGPYWDVLQLLGWAPYIKAGQGGLVHGQGKKVLAVLKTAVKEAAQGLHTTREVLAQVLSEEAIAPALARDLTWFKEHLLKQRRDRAGYPLKIMEAYGVEALRREPGVIIGTIHSVKGGQADVVFLFPDLPPSVDYLGSQSAREAAYRQFYVGITRAREALFLMTRPRGCVGYVGFKPFPRFQRHKSQYFG
jgi:superfamily I DNA/RNA helicase